MRSTGLSLGMLLVSVVVVVPADANKCAAVKLKAAGKRASATLACHAKAVGKGATVDAECATKAADKLAAAFAKAETLDPPCTVADLAAIATRIDAFVTEVTGALGSPGPSTCAQRKLQAAGKKADGKHKCHAKAVGKGRGTGST